MRVHPAHKAARFAGGPVAEVSRTRASPRLSCLGLCRLSDRQLACKRAAARRGHAHRSRQHKTAPPCLRAGFHCVRRRLRHGAALLFYPPLA
eukprot:365289-Chlamydomonas_euryale.AAC.7